METGRAHHVLPSVPSRQASDRETRSSFPSLWGVTAENSTNVYFTDTVSFFLWIVDRGNIICLGRMTAPFEGAWCSDGQETRTWDVCLSNQTLSFSSPTKIITDKTNKNTAQLSATLKRQLKKAWRRTKHPLAKRTHRRTDQRLAIGKGQRQQGLFYGENTMSCIHVHKKAITEQHVHSSALMASCRGIDACHWTWSWLSMSSATGFFFFQFLSLRLTLCVVHSSALMASCRGIDACHWTWSWLSMSSATGFFFFQFLSLRLTLCVLLSTFLAAYVVVCSWLCVVRAMVFNRGIFLFRMAFWWKVKVKVSYLTSVAKQAKTAFLHISKKSNLSHWWTVHLWVEWSWSEKARAKFSAERECPGNAGLESWYYRKRGSASYIVREWLLWVVERERETPVTSSISRWNREWSCMWLPRQRVDPMHMHTRRRVLSLQLLSSARSAWQAKPQTATLATAQWPK